MSKKTTKQELNQYDKIVKERVNDKLKRFLNFDNPEGIIIALLSNLRKYFDSLEKLYKNIFI